ncbi:MAG: nickel-binding protein [Gaiellales bacterium]
MADFLAEVYTPRLDGAALAKLVARLEAVAETMSAETPVTYLRSIHVPEDETCFHLFEAESAEVVYETGRRAGLTFDRVAAAVEPVTSKGGAR